MGTFKNVARLLSSPALFKDYLIYLYSRVRNGGIAVRSLYDGIEVAGFNGFSEFHSVVDHLEPHEYSFLTNYPFSSGPLVDIGANLGVITLTLARRFPERPIHSFEPHPDTVKALRGNLSRNEAENVVVHDKAVGKEDSSVLIDAGPEARANARQVVEPEDYAVEVPSVSLDTWSCEEGITSISLLKVDVEGYEMSVFEGGRTLLEENRVAAVYFEVCPDLACQAGFGPKAAAGLLSECGYALYRLSSSGTLTPVQTADIDGVELENWIALRSENEIKEDGKS